ncbi:MULTISPECIES: hypothetical protein [Cupriavidus]
MNNTPSASYKGFDLYPLVYKVQPAQSWPRAKPDRSFTASVVICREGYRPGGERTKVFRLETEDRQENVWVPGGSGRFPSA